jgi:sugar phosphate isomerase/epimerase
MSDDWKSAVNKLKEHADRLGMTFVQAHSQGGNPFNIENGHADFIIKATKRSIEICAELGIKNTVAHCGLKEGISKEESFERNRVFYRDLLGFAENYGVNVLTENSCKLNIGGMYHICSGKDTAELVDFVDHPLFGVCWDTGHANCEGSQYDEIMALGDRLKAIHYNDNHGNGDEHIAPFLGTLNHDEVISALIDVGYKGYFTLECNSSLIPYDSWLRPRRRFEKDKRLAEPQLFMQRHMEKMMYEISEYILSSYGLLEK